MIEVLEDVPDGVVGWMRHLTYACSWLSPNDMKAFPTAELDAAKAWAAG